jgi:hypothetical protein
MRNPLIVIALGAAVLAGCEQSTSPMVAGIGPATFIPPGNIAGNVAPLFISPSSIQLLVGGVFQFTTNAPLTLRNQVEWGTLESNVVTISPTGLVNAVGLGTATITARYSFDTLRVAVATVFVNGTTPKAGTGGITGASGVP